MQLTIALLLASYNSFKYAHTLVKVKNRDILNKRNTENLVILYCDKVFLRSDTVSTILCNNLCQYLKLLDNPKINIFL